MAFDADAVLEYWLGPEAERDHVQRSQWWSKDPDFDAEVRSRFGPAIEAAAAGTLDGWLTSPRGRLAIVILLDQFTRNAFRDSAAMYAHDPQAVQVALGAIDGGHDRSLRRIERYFLYMPLMHAEDLAHQDRAVALFGALAEEAPDLDKALRYAHAHRDIVARFGRFPHRNAILGRPTTPEEAEFLRQPGSSF